jgi:tripartite-type tricarboxylate transporter receptor subunit TctC
MTKSILAAALAVAAGLAGAQSFPTKPIRIVVPNPAGGTVDIVSRAVAQPMSAALGQNVIIDIRVGAATIIGTEIVARAPADGHTLLAVTASFTTNPLFRQLPYDTLNGFTPVARVASTPLMFAVHPTVPVESLEQLVALARSKPKSLNYASSMPGSSIHLAMELFSSLAKVQMNLVPYQGGVQATLGVVGGHAGILVGPLSDAAPHLASGKLRPVAVMSLERAELAKDVPTVAESGYPGFQAVSWFGFVAPAGTPQAVITRLSAEMLRALESPLTRNVFAKIALSPAPMPPGAFGAFIRDEMRRYGDIVKQADIKVEQ